MENGTCFFKGHIPVRKGSSSVRVLSTPSARAIVDNFLILLRRSFKHEVGRPKQRDGCNSGQKKQAGETLAEGIHNEDETFT